MAEIEATRELLRWKCQELRTAVEAMRALHEPADARLVVKIDRRKDS